MTDKVQKIREEVVRMHNLLPVMDGDNISVNYADRICTTLEMYIDSLPNESKDKCQGCNNVKGCITCVDGSEWAHIEEAKVPKVFEDMLNAKTPAESLGISQEEWNKIEEECIFGEEKPVSEPIDFEKELYKAFGQVKDFTLGMRIAKWFYDMGKNSQEPVREELEKAAVEWFNSVKYKSDLSGTPINAFKAGARWQKEKTIRKACKWIKEINNHHYIMRYSDSCEPTANELIEWFKNYMEE